MRPVAPLRCHDRRLVCRPSRAISLGGNLDREHDLTFLKSPSPELFERTINRPGKEVATILKAWLAKGGQLTPAEELKRLCQLKGYSDLALAKWLAQFWSVEQADLSDMLSNAQPDQIQTAFKKFLDVRVNGAL